MWWSSSQGMTGKMPVPPQNLCSRQGVGHIPAVILVGQASRLSVHYLEHYNAPEKISCPPVTEWLLRALLSLSVDTRGLTWLDAGSIVKQFSIVNCCTISRDSSSEAQGTDTEIPRLDDTLGSMALKIP